MVPFGVAESWACSAAQELSGSIAVGPVKPGGRIVVRVDGKARAARPCDRCGENTELLVESANELTYLPAVVPVVEEPVVPTRTPAKPARPPAPKPMTSTRMTEEEAAEPDEESLLSDEDLEVGWYHGGELALTDVLREALALELPLRIVCADESECDSRTRLLLGEPPANEGAFGALKSLSPDTRNARSVATGLAEASSAEPRKKNRPH